MGERPWITARLAFTGPRYRFAPTPGLEFNKDGTATLTAFVVFKNIGHSIATDIYAATRVSPTLFKPDEIYKEMNRQSKWCDGIRKLPFAIPPDSPKWPPLFPGEEGSQSVTLDISKQDMEEYERRLPASPSKVRTVSATIYACVNYQSSFNSDIHQTRIIYVLLPIRVINGTVPANKLDFVEYPLGSKNAD
jgi:hypothetical protein